MRGGKFKLNLIELMKLKILPIEPTVKIGENRKKLEILMEKKLSHLNKISYKIKKSDGNDVVITHEIQK